MRELSQHPVLQPMSEIFVAHCVCTVRCAMSGKSLTLRGEWEWEWEAEAVGMGRGRVGWCGVWCDLSTQEL